MELLIVLTFCSIRNYNRARAANLNAALWSFYTFIACLVSWFIGGIIAVYIMIARDPQLYNLLTHEPVDKQAVFKYMTGKNIIVSELFLLVASIGGYLFVRHQLIRRTQPPNTKD